jgi:hypothetical protein
MGSWESHYLHAGIYNLTCPPEFLPYLTSGKLKDKKNKTPPPYKYFFLYTTI